MPILKGSVNIKNFKLKLIVIISFLISSVLLYNLYLHEIDKVESENKIISIENSIKLLEEKRDNPEVFLVNKDTLLNESYKPSDIVESKLPFLPYITTTKLNKNVAIKAKEMFDAAKKDGIYLMGASGFRSHNVQVILFNSNVKKKGITETLKYSAPPGASEHETGFSMDIVSTEFEDLDFKFENTKSFKWLINNCYKYGFILRYPKDKVSITKYAYEPWHYRYVGKVAAEDIMKNNLCLEEYLSKLDYEITFLKNKLNNKG